ncbi:hypothetical protein SAMN02745174_02049 [Cetobacterium ceti]|uniref:Uncharacterized protein n=1 Tax=Cetobacterium ceti TaxID=180163 RepID=A0A1T4PV66_9FUSO|nr:hypothetical protein [Cetobacterium ceti]SJZ95141.1 hypothetical protein SAMN02745174_02049 [Cetobacterium ceti]
MNLKEIMQQDLEDIFFNEDEFAKKIDFCGTEIVAIKSIQSYKDKYLTKASEQGLGTYKNGFALIIKQKDLNIIPEPSDEVEIDGIRMFVLDVEKTAQLIYSIYLERIDD